MKLTQDWWKKYRTFLLRHTQCAKDCGSPNHVCKYKRTLVFMQLKLYYFNVCALIFFTVEESSQPTKDANKILQSIFLALKATIFDTQGIFWEEKFVHLGRYYLPSLLLSPTFFKVEIRNLETYGLVLSNNINYKILKIAEQ